MRNRPYPVLKCLSLSQVFSKLEVLNPRDMPGHESSRDKARARILEHLECGH